MPRCPRRSEFHRSTDRLETMFSEVNASPSVWELAWIVPARSNKLNLTHLFGNFSKSGSAIAGWQTLIASAISVEREDVEALIDAAMLFCKEKSLNVVTGLERLRTS